MMFLIKFGFVWLFNINWWFVVFLYFFDIMVLLIVVELAKSEFKSRFNNRFDKFMFLCYLSVC